MRIQVDKSAQMELRIGQTASVAISHGARSTPSKGEQHCRLRCAVEQRGPRKLRGM